MLCFAQVIFSSHGSCELQVSMLIDFDLVLIALYLIHHLLGWEWGLNDCWYVALVISHHAIVVLSQLLQILFIDLDLGLNVLFAFSLLRVNEQMMHPLILCVYLQHLPSAFINHGINSVDHIHCVPLWTANSWWRSQGSKPVISSRRQFRLRFWALHNLEVVCLDDLFELINDMNEVLIRLVVPGDNITTLIND